MTQQEFIAKERRVKEIENAALMNLATDEMIEEANKLRKEISEARKKSIESLRHVKRALRIIPRNC